MRLEGAVDVLARLSYGKPLGFRVPSGMGRIYGHRTKEWGKRRSPAKVIPNFQYSSGNKNVVALRSASVMTQNLVPLLIV